jgi:hypothetical protein
VGFLLVVLHSLLGFRSLNSVRLDSLEAGIPSSRGRQQLANFDPGAQVFLLFVFLSTTGALHTNGQLDLEVGTCLCLPCVLVGGGDWRAVARVRLKRRWGLEKWNRPLPPAAVDQ